MNRLGAESAAAVKRVETRIPIEAFDGELPSSIFIDQEATVAVILATSPTRPYIALIFDLQTGLFLGKKAHIRHPAETWLFSDSGVFRTRGRCVIEQLKVLPERLPSRSSGVPLPSMTAPPMTNLDLTHTTHPPSAINRTGYA